MKRYISGAIGLMMSMLLFSCDDNYEKMFSGEASLYLDLSATDLDSMTYSFVGTIENSLVVNLPVGLSGYAAAYDRAFRLKVKEDKTTAIAGKHYEALKDQYILEKGKYAVNIPITIFYTGDLDSVTVRLAVEIDADENFTVGIPYRQEATIVFSNLLPDIKNWALLYRKEFGEYSKVKHRYILSELKLEKLEDSIEFYYSKDEKLWAAYGMHMNNFFAEHEVYDEHHERIKPWI